jgi:hypothetical protein
MSGIEGHGQITRKQGMAAISAFEILRNDTWGKAMQSA